jgi:hypothetical protein
VYSEIALMGCITPEFLALHRARLAYPEMLEWDKRLLTCSASLKAFSVVLGFSPPKTRFLLGAKSLSVRSCTK